MTMMLSRQVTRQAARQYSRSTVKQEPKMHKAVGNWEALASKRPVDEDDTHVRYSYLIYAKRLARFRIPSSNTFLFF